MNGAGRRSKGAAAERELAKLLGEQLASEVTRNLEQTRSGGHDLIGIPGWAIEVKRQESLSLSAWWEQAHKQAENANLCPALAYRQNRKPWRFVVQISDLADNFENQPYTAEISLEAFATLVRESLLAVAGAEAISSSPAISKGTVQMRPF